MIDHLLAVCEEVVQTWQTGLLEFTRPRGKEVLRQLQHRRRLLQPGTGSSSDTPCQSAGAVAAQVERYRDVPWAEQRLVLLARGLWAGRRLGVPMSAVMEAVKALAGGGVGSIRAARGLRADAGVRAAFRAAMHG